jgi:hypothetical protein
VQCWKGILENKGVLGRDLLRGISFIYQKLMRIADNITPQHVGQDNAAIYVMVARKIHNTPQLGLNSVYSG